MIERCFTFLEGIAQGKQRKLQAQGIATWSDFLKATHVQGISDWRKRYYDRKITEARRMVNAADAGALAEMLPRAEHWRLWPLLRSGAVFLDIECDGVGPYGDVTMVGLFDGLDTHIMIKDINLDLASLSLHLEKYSVIVTFNGASFDLPYLEKRGCKIPSIPHIDLRHVAARQGFTGGLKAIEERLGIERPPLVGGMHGGDAITLWRMYKATGDNHYLDILIAYNEQDVISLRKLMQVCYELEQKD